MCSVLREVIPFEGGSNLVLTDLTVKKYFRHLIHCQFPWDRPYLVAHRMKQLCVFATRSLADPKRPVPVGSVGAFNIHGLCGLLVQALDYGSSVASSYPSSNHL